MGKRDRRDYSSESRSSSQSDRRKKDKKKKKHSSKHKRKYSRDRDRDKDRSYRNNRDDRRDGRGGGDRRNRKDDGGGGHFRFDSPPKDHELTKGIMAAAASIGGGTIANAQSILQSIHSMSMAQTAKIDRKLYVGNLPPGITQRMLIDVVNEAMLSLNVIEEPGNPVVSAWISSDGHYAFVEFRTADEANHGFKLQAMNIQGSEIKIGRPKAYSGTMNAIGLMSQMSGSGNAILGLKGQMYHPLDDTSTQGIQNPLMGGKMADEVIQVQEPSRVLVIRNIATFKDTKDDNLFSDLYSDVLDKCSLYGKVLQVKIPRPEFIKPAEESKIAPSEEGKTDQPVDGVQDAQIDEPRIEEESKEEIQEETKEQVEGGKKKQKKYQQPVDPLDDPKNYSFPEGFGSAYIEFTSYLEAKRARKNIHLMRYGNRLVECTYHDEKKFENNDFTRNAAVKLEQRGFEFEGLENCAIEFLEPRQSEPMKI